jgi:ABC-type glycerol-3-phosphate transport system substrate-binding protein
MSRTLATAVIVGLALAACSGGDSILESGNEQATTTVAANTQATDPPASDDGSSPDATTGDTNAPETTAAPTTTTTPLEALPPCPVDALATAAGPVEVLLWHGWTGETETAITALTDAYNASQSQVRVQLEPQGSYDETFDKFIQSSQSSRPDLVGFPEYYVQQTID